MKKLTIRNLSSNPKRFLSLSALFVIFLGVSCVDNVNSPSSDDPSGSGIVDIRSLPEFLFGNASGYSEIEVNTETFPDGSDVEFKITGSSLPSLLRGCLLDSDTDLSNGGRAFATYLAGINIVSGEALLSEEPLSEAVNIAVTVTRSGTQDTESDFVQIPLLGVGIIPPEDFELEVPETGDPSSVGATLEFLTVGVPPGTIVNFSLSNNALGSLNPTSTPVLGSEESGSAVTEYTAVNGAGGTQVVTARAVLPNPADVDPDCPNVPEAERTIEEVVIITQSVSTGE